MRWNIDTITDVHGNQIQYEYENWAADPEHHGQVPTQLVVTTDNARTEAIRYNYLTLAPNQMTRLNSDFGSEVRFQTNP